MCGLWIVAVASNLTLVLNCEGGSARDNGERPPISTHQQIPLTLHSSGSNYKIQLRSHCILLKFVTKDNKKIKLNKCYGEFYGVGVR